MKGAAILEIENLNVYFALEKTFPDRLSAGVIKRIVNVVDGVNLHEQGRDSWACGSEQLGEIDPVSIGDSYGGRSGREDIDLRT